ncbi:hypothetical protein EBZ80_22480 [bacterium]|nr:hypothetical protein [bacterium]
MSIIRTRILQIAALSILASCGEQKATVGGDKADSVPETSANTSDSIGKRLGIKMPATAVDFTQIPARDPDRAEVFTMSASRDGNSVALRTPNTILLLNGAFQTEKEIPADFLINSTSDYYLRYGLNFVFDIQSVLADTSGNLKYLLNAYRITKGHANFGQRESRAILDLPNGEILYDVDSLGDQIVGVTRHAVASPVRIYAFNSAGLRVQSLNITSMTSGTFVNNVVAIGGTAAGGTNSAKINEYWVYGPDNVQPQTTVYRIAAEGKDAGKLMGKCTPASLLLTERTPRS